MSLPPLVILHHYPKQQWQPLAVTCHEAQNPMQAPTITPTITNLNLSELRTMNHDTAGAVSATATCWEQREARERERKGKTERTNNRSDVTRIYRQGKTCWGLWGGEDDESERKSVGQEKAVKEWPGRQRESSECWQCCCVLVVPARLSGYLR